MAPGDVLQAAIVLSRVVQGHPAGEVLHRRGPGPVVEVLVEAEPRLRAARRRRLAEDLVVEEAAGAPEQLVGRQSEPRAPDQVVEARRQPPGARSLNSYHHYHYYCQDDHYH